MDTTDMFKNTTLKIPDYIAPFDIPKVYEYFDYYNLATLKDVTYYDHVEPEYNAEDKPFYGFCIIEIDHWHNNNSAKFFYNAISENKGKMVYNDPYYWDVEFHDIEVKEEEKNELNQTSNLNLEVNEDNNVDQENYVFESEDDTNDSHYKFYEKYDNSSRTNKKRKYSSIIENLKAENKDLRELLIKKQKNYKKNNKNKDNKPSWYRRLRVKVYY
jgi:hypothetical protein